MRSREPKATLPCCRRRSHARGEPTVPFFCSRCQRTVCTWCQGPRAGAACCARCQRGFLPLLKLAKASLRATKTSMRKAWKAAIAMEVTTPLEQVDQLLQQAQQLLHRAGVAHVERRVDKHRRAA